jgi:O-antigen/teichoic acid export membrane protein
MAGVSRTDVIGTTQPAPGRLHGPALVSNLVSGAFLLVVLAFLSWPLAVVGAAYVAAASVFLAAVYARTALTRRQEAAAWVAPWLAAIALWTCVGAGIEGGTSTWLLTAWFGLVIATPCYLGWQAVALAVRQLLAWRARPVSA